MAETPKDRFERVRELLLAADEIDPADQQTFVRARAADAALADEVLDLLRARAQRGRFDDLLDRFGGLAGATQAEDLPASIGPYRILSTLGTGGMGDVYLAERDDGQFHHRVAIKVLRADRAGPELKRRFLAERQILAQLIHRNIAWLLDGNVTAEGLPYLVMEYVEGMPLVEYSDARHLDITRRLRLFLDVCGAVEYAHRRLVVHRDLKPANILVTDEGVVKLLDFGIAKLIDATDDTTRTRTGQRVMTPEYASPEQVRGETIGTASDVYQLGVLLYELLTGRRPYRVTRSLPSIELAVLSADPLRPSAAITVKAAPASDDDPAKTAQVRGTTASRLHRRLAGDLDQIILKALRKEPDQRYGSATELAEDVRRHLEGRPVLARRGTVRYRASRFVRRHRVGVAAVMLLMISLVAGAAGTAWQARQAAAERDRARAEAEKATRLAEFLTGMFDVAAEGNVRVDTLRLLPVLERGAARIRAQLADQPDIQAAALITVSDLYEKLGRYEEAQTYGEEALRVRRGTLGPDHPDVAEALDNLGGVMMDRSDIAAAGTYWEDAVRIRRSLLEAAGAAADSALRVRLASSTHNLAVVHWRMRRLEQADSLESQAIGLYEAAHAANDMRVASSLDVLAMTRQDQGRADEGVTLLRRALEIRRNALPSPHMNIAASLNNLATGLMNAGQFAEAEPLLRESLEMRRSLLGAEHPQVANATHNLGVAMKELGRDAEAIALYSEALTMRRRLLAADHLDIANSLATMGVLHFDRERHAEALPLLAESLPMWKRGLGAEHPLVFKTVGMIGHCLSSMGRHAEAERELLAAYTAIVGATGESHAEARRVRGYLRELYEAWGRPADAARYRDAGGG
jgi:serine/threonine-protein kinase